MKGRFPSFLLLTLAALVMLVIQPSTAQQPTPTLFGSLSNFDCLNDTEQEAHGFEIELDGISSQSIGGTYNSNRYGSPTLEDFPGGVYVRYKSAWLPLTQRFASGTPITTNFTSTTGHQCLLGTPGYLSSGCDHFGVWLRSAPTATIYHWLVADPQNPGALIRFGAAAPIPVPTWAVIPPAQPAGAPVVAAEIHPPRPPHPEQQFGEAQWVKVYKTELSRKIALDELVTDNPVVPHEPAQTEMEWELVQHNPHSANSGTLTNQGPLGPGSRVVIRRYEYYKYTGAYDPIDHEVKCGGNGDCNAPLEGELGKYIGAQMAAADVVAPSATASASAASFDASVLGSESIVAAFGVALATTTESAFSVPLPTLLGGSMVKVKDSAGTERLAPLFFVSAGQINYQVPAGTVAGTAGVTITSGDGSVAAGTVLIAAVAPGVFAANANGQGIAAGLALRVKADGSQSFEQIAQFDAAQKQFISLPIDLGPSTDQVFLVLFGTGIRFRSSLSSVSARLRSIDVQVLYAGAQGSFVGLDQINLPVPRSLIGRGEIDVDLVVDGKKANTVRVNIK